VTTPGRSGYRLLISRAGDWTGRFIDDPPSHVWVRGIPVSAPMAKTALLYKRVVYVVTGSGIGPCLGQILADRVDARLVWSTRDPRATYGDALVDEVQAAQPDAFIWDTTERGKPDLVQLAHQACRDFGAEAVFVVSNKPTTTQLVHALERRGIPAFGPIWDS
jgi:ferredoxin-NADP reductase